MMMQSRNVRRFLAEIYLAGLAGYDRHTIDGRSGPRDFNRVCVVAATKKRNGIANGARLQVDALRRAGIEAELLDATPALRNPLFRIQHAPATAYVFHSGGPQLASMLASVLPHAADAWRVAYWAWELPLPPRRWPNPEGLVSEIWTPSEFARRSLGLRFKVPIRVVPHAIPSGAARRQRTADSVFTVLTLADSRSSFQRKNPVGAIRAFLRAFGDSQSARLIVKLSSKCAGHDALRSETQGLKNIEILDRYLDEEDLRRLYCSADVLLSLHRAEGFGMPMQEAMALGVPVVATGWSGNLDFMNEHNAILVPAREVPVEDETVYRRYRDVVWAEPDEPAATRALTRLFEDQELCERISQAAFLSAKQFFESWRLPE